MNEHESTDKPILHGWNEKKNKTMVSPRLLRDPESAQQAAANHKHTHRRAATVRSIEATKEQYERAQIYGNVPRKGGLNG